MYLAEAEEIFDYWQDHPPTYHLVDLIARILGWEGPAQRSDVADVPDAAFDLSPEMAAAIGRAAGVPPLIVSLDEMRERNKQKMLEIAREKAAKRQA